MVYCAYRLLHARRTPEGLDELISREWTPRVHDEGATMSQNRLCSRSSFREKHLDTFDEICHIDMLV